MEEPAGQGGGGGAAGERWAAAAAGCEVVQRRWRLQRSACSAQASRAQGGCHTPAGSCNPCPWTCPFILLFPVQPTWHNGIQVVLPAQRVRHILCFHARQPLPHALRKLCSTAGEAHTHTHVSTSAAAGATRPTPGGAAQGCSCRVEVAPKASFVTSATSISPPACLRQCRAT